MSLQNSQRSYSAPQPLTASGSRKSTPASKVPVESSGLGSAPRPHKPPTTSSPLVSQHSPHAYDEATDAFNLEGFFPRSNSYYSLSTLPGSQQNRHWAHSEQEKPQPPPLTVDGDSSSAPDHVHTHLILSPNETDPDIQSEDRVTGLVTSAAKVVTLPPLATVSPTYEHEHLIHSYDHLHTALCEKRRSATVPDLNKWRVKKNMYDAERKRLSATEPGGKGKDLVASSLFSPTEEKVDYFAADGEAGEEEGENDGSWSAYIYESAKRLLVSPTEPSEQP